MAEMETLNVRVPSGLLAEMTAAVDGGEYPTISLLVHDALMHWRAARLSPAEKLEELRALVKPALQSLDRGEGIPIEQQHPALIPVSPQAKTGT